MKKFFKTLVLIFALLCCTVGFAACGEVDIKSIEITNLPQANALAVGDYHKFELKLSPKKARTKDVSWSSSDESVARINSKGLASIIAPGVTQITAMSKKNSSVKDTFTLVIPGNSSQVLLFEKTCTYNGEPQAIGEPYNPNGIELKITYKSPSYTENEFAPINAGTYDVTARNKATDAVLATTTLTINKKQATIEISKEYAKRYGEDDPEFTGVVSGLIEGDSINYTLERIVGENVATYRIFANVTTHLNYNVRVSEGSLTITKLPVKIIADNKSSVYGDPLQTPTYTLQRMDNSLLEEVYKTQIIGAPQIQKPTETTRLSVGTYPISCNSMTSTNLEIASIQDGNYIVDKKSVIISIAQNQFKYSGENEPALKYAIDGTLEGDDLSGCLSRTPGELVGFYEYNIDQSINTNYNITTGAGATVYQFEIKSNVVSIAFNTFAIDYSQTNKEAYIPNDCYTYTISINEVPIEYTRDGAGNVYLNSTDSITLGHEVTKELHMSDEEKAIYYQKWKVALSNVATNGYADPAKYTYNLVEGFKYLNLLDITLYANETYKTYGEIDPTLSYSAEGFLEGDDIDTVFKTVSLKRAVGENVANYEITLADEIELFDTKLYYKPIFVPGLFIIEKRLLEVKPISYTEENPVYYGETPKPLQVDVDSLNLAARDNIKDVLAGNLTRANNENVGQYAILQGELRLISENYILEYTPGKYTIVARPIIITAINKTIQYGETVKKYQYSYSIVDEFTYKDEDGEDVTEVRYYDAADPTFSGNLALTTYGLLHANNTYTIGQGNLTAGLNFSITYTPGVLTVVPREVTIAFTPQAYQFDLYEEEDPDPIFDFTPALAYNDKCNLKYFGKTSQQENDGIIKLKRNEDETFALELEFVAADGSLLEGEYNVTIDENFIELFYLGDSILEVTIDSKAGGQIVTKTYGDLYQIMDIFEIKTVDSKYTITYDATAFNIKGITNNAGVTPPSYNFNAGAYTVTVFDEAIRITNNLGEDVSERFVVKVKEYGNLVIEKATLTMTSAPTVETITYGDAAPTFRGGVYTFTNGNGELKQINGELLGVYQGEYTTSSTATYAVQSTPHLIMATFTPDDTNFESVTINNIELYVTQAMIETDVLEWRYGASVETLGTTADDVIFSTAANLEGVTNITYDGVYTEENEYYIPTSLHNYRFLNQSLAFSHIYTGVRFQDEEGEDGDTGFMYYIEGGAIHKVFPANSTNFYCVLDKSSTDSVNVLFYYNDGDKDYLLTNSSEYGDGTPVYWQSSNSPSYSGIYIARVRLASLNPNYKVFDDGDDLTEDLYIYYYNTFLVNKIAVEVYNFTSEITYASEVAFYYITNPEEIYGKVLKYYSREGMTYAELGNAPTDVGTYAVEFLIDQANYYYYKDYYNFDIVPIVISVEWDENASFDFIDVDFSITRNFIIYAGSTKVYDTSDEDAVLPDWLVIKYSGTMKNGQSYPSGGGFTDVIPSYAGDYTITIETKEVDSVLNYTGSAENTYTIAPIFYKGSISISPDSITYDIAYNDGATGAIAFYNKLVETMVTAEEDDWLEYDLKLSYLNHPITANGSDTTAVQLLNKAGGPYKIVLSIKSKNGNIKETLKNASLSVSKTNVPTMSNYELNPVEIPFTGTYVYNALTSYDKSQRFEPQTYNSADNTYIYQHNGDMNTYFGIFYQYYRIWNVGEDSGEPQQAPITPDAGGWIYMVKAHITAGANYIPPDQTDFTGYFYVVKTTVNLRAENIETTYTGSEIPLPQVIATNGASQNVAIKYESEDTAVALWVKRTIYKDGAATPMNTKKITQAGTYRIVFELMETENFHPESEGSIFSTQCTLKVNNKPIDGLDEYVIKPDQFISTELRNVFYIDATKAKTYNKDYTNSTGSTVYILLCVTDKNDGTGVIYQLKSKNDASIQNLAAGTYYYYVDINTSGSISGAIRNYTRSEYYQFEIVRKEVDLTLTPEAEGGITISYNTGSQGYSSSNIIVKKKGTNTLVNDLSQDDFIIRYKKDYEGDENYSTTEPVINGVYDVEISCYSDNYISTPIYTRMTIDAPVLDITGQLNYTYSFVEDLTLSLTASGSESPHTITFDQTTKYNQSSLSKADLGHWFLFRDNFGVTTPDGLIDPSFSVDCSGQTLVIGQAINDRLAEFDSKLYTLAEMNELPAGIHNMLIIYVSSDINFAITFKELTFTVNACAIANEAIDSVNTAGIDYDKTAQKFTQSNNQSAISAYSDGAWSFNKFELNETIVFEVSVKIKSPYAENYDSAVIKNLNLVASITGTIEGTTIKDAFPELSSTNTNPIPTTASTLSFESSNYALSESTLTFILNTIFSKQQTTVFAEKKLMDGSYEVTETDYGAIFLDKYWANLFEGSKIDTTYPDNLVVNEKHIFLHRLITLPSGSDVEKFRSAWNYGEEDTWFDFYTWKVFNYDGGVKGSQVTNDRVYKSSDEERNDLAIKEFYKYDLDKKTDAGLYLVEITLNSSNYFATTTLYAVVRIKPTTFYAKTTTGNGDGLIDKTVNSSEIIKVYESDLSDAEATNQKYTLEYYDGDTLVYASKYSGGASGTYTVATHSPKASYAEFLALVGEGETKNFIVKTIPDDPNKMYVEDIQILVISGTIDIGNFNIYDTLDVIELAQVNSTIGTLYEMSKQGPEGLSFPTILKNSLALSNNTLTESSISILKLLDQTRTLPEVTDNKYIFDVLPDANNQFVVGEIPLIINFENGSSISVMVSFTINLKIITEIDVINFTFNNTPQAPVVTAYFQGWTATTPVSGTAPVVDQVTIAEKLSSAYTGSRTTTYINTETNATSNTAPTNAGSYIVQSTFVVNFAGATEAVTFNCRNNFTISKIEAAISMNSQEFLYNGNYHELTATSAVPGFTPSIVYRDANGSEATRVRDAGTYYAIASIDSPNYFGTAVATLTIKATSTRIEVTMPGSYLYNGSPIKPTYRVFNDNNEDITANVLTSTTETYNNAAAAPVAAGAYQFKLVITETPNYLPNTAIANYVIDKAEASITITPPASTSFTGSAIVPTISVSQSSLQDYLTITYNGEDDPPVNAGVYEVYVYCNPPATSNYLPASASYTYAILPQALVVSYTDLSIDYSSDMDERAIRPIYPPDAEVTLTYSGYEYNADGSLSDTLITRTEFPVNAGVYTITAAAANTNYEGRTSHTLTISRIVPEITFSGFTFAFTGSEQSPNISTTVSGLDYVTRYTGVNNNGVAYDSVSKPKNAGRYIATVSFEGNKNYVGVSNSQEFEITKLSGLTLEFDNLSLIQVYTGEALEPTAIAKQAGTERAELASSITFIYGENTEAPVNAGTYNVKAILENCNYAAEPATATFTIRQSSDYTVTLDNEGILELDATRIGVIELTETYTIRYSGKTYLENGELSTVDNYNSFTFPGVAGEFVATIISNNYVSRDFAFVINKKNLTAKLVLIPYNLTYGTLPAFSETILVDSTTYKVKYLFKIENGTDWEESVPTALGNHNIKMVVCDANAYGEKEAAYNITSTNPATSKLITESPFYMYTGNAIVVNVSLYLNGILQSETTNKIYYLGGSPVGNVLNVGEYTVKVSTSDGAQDYQTNFTVVPQINLSVDSNLVFNGSAKEVSYSFATSSDATTHGSHISLVITKNGYTVSEIKNAGDYVISVCYDGYPILTREVTIAKKIVNTLSYSDIIMTYGEMNRIPTHIDTHKVNYLISISGTTQYQEITPPVGNHKIKFVIDEENHQGECVCNISVSKKPLVWDVEDFEIEYTGNDIELPSNIGNFEYVSYKYSTSAALNNQIEGLPRNIGTYYIVAMASSPNYSVTYKDESRPYVKVEIIKATPTYIVTGLTQTYDGLVKAPTAVAIFNGTQYSTSISNSNMINAGTYDITFSISSDITNFNLSPTYTFTIEKAEVDINYTLPENLVYDGSQKTIIATPSIAEVGSVRQEILRNGASSVIQNAGTYTATLRTDEVTNYKAAEKVVIFDVLPAPTQVTCIVENYNYTGTQKPVLVTTVPAETNHTITYNGSATPPTNAGTYTALITVTPTDTNYSVETVEFVYTIVKVLDTITYTGLEDGYFYYDGTVKNLTSVSSGSNTHNVKYFAQQANGTYAEVASTAVDKEGNYRVTITTTGNSNYYGITKLVYFSIFKQQITASVDSKVVDYTGSPHSIIPTGANADLVKVTYTGKMYSADGKCNTTYASSETAPTAAGIYTATITPIDDSRYVINGNTSTKLVIKRKQLDVTLSITNSVDNSSVSSDTIIVDYTGSEYVVTAKVNIGGTLQDVATVSPNALKVRLIGTETNTTLVNGGSYEIIVDLDCESYIGYYTRLITIRPELATIFATQTTVNYTGAPVNIGYTIVNKSGVDITETVAPYVTILYTQNGLPVADGAINVGQYVANIAIANGSYSANATYNFSIIETKPDLQYRPGADPSKYVYLSTESSQGVEKFDTEKFSVQLNGVDMVRNEYTYTFKKLEYVEAEDGGLVQEWQTVTTTAGQVLEATGSYQLIITVTNTTKYKDNLEGKNNGETDEVLTWEYLFYVTGPQET